MAGFACVLGPFLAHPSHVSWLHKGAPPTVPVAQSTWRRRFIFIMGVTPVSAHPWRVSWPHRGLHLRPQWQCSHVGVTPVLAHPSHVSWTHTELHRVRFSQLRYSQLHMVGSFARIIFWGEGGDDRNISRVTRALRGDTRQRLTSGLIYSNIPEVKKHRREEEKRGGRYEGGGGAR